LTSKEGLLSVTTTGLPRLTLFDAAQLAQHHHLKVHGVIDLEHGTDEFIVFGVIFKLDFLATTSHRA